MDRTIDSNKDFMHFFPIALKKLPDIYVAFVSLMKYFGDI